MRTATPSAADLAETRALVLHRISEDLSFVLATHENMDGDAIGSLLGMHGLLAALGKDSLMPVPPGELPLPLEYRFFDLAGAIKSPPADIAQRTVVLLDCGNIDRNSADALREGAQPAEHRPPSRQHLFRHGRSCGCGRLLYCGDHLVSDARASA